MMKHHIGAHVVCEEGDILSITLAGDLGAADMQALLGLIDGVIARYGRYATLIDTRQMGALTPAARRVVSQWRGILRCYGNAIFGEGIAVRVAMTMALRAIQLLNHQNLQAAFVKTEAEAREWIKGRGESAPK